jgi:endonuclease/exonuclease/phosphatase family metal-dependent hydrolase
MAAFKVMTWNVENLFQPGAGDGPAGQEAFDEKLSALSQVIAQLDPDVLALQEVGDSESFNDLSRALNGLYPHERLSNHPDPRGIRVGFLSKLPIEDHEEIVDFLRDGLPEVPGIDHEGDPTEVTRLGRGAVRISVRPAQGLRIHLITAHLKSKLLTYPGTAGRSRFTPKNENERARVAALALLKRAAEATALRVKANGLLEGNAEEAVILLGDMNDVTEAATTQMLQGPSGSQIGTGGFNRPDKGDDTRLFNLAPLIPEERRYSRVHAGRKELIDHIFISEELLRGQPRRLPQADSHVSATSPLPSLGDDPNSRRGKPGSDHAPLTATFEL